MSIIEQLKQKLPPLTYPDCYDYILSLPEEQYPKYLKLVYFDRQRRILNYDNPQYFSEKLQWIKLYDATEEKTRLTDKISVREFVAKNIGNEYLRELYDVKEHFIDLDFDKCPNNFVIKCNHGCKMHYYINDKENLLKNPTLVSCLMNKFEKWLSTKFIGIGSLELQYKNIMPMIFAEEYIKEKNSSLPEYQVYCFHGQPKLIEKLIFTIPNYRVLWNEKMEPSTVKFNNKKNVVECATKEVYKIVELAKILSQNINFVRVDFILGKNKIFFNEMTFTPFSGFLPLNKSDDLLFGTYLNINKGKNYDRQTKQ